MIWSADIVLLSQIEEKVVNYIKTLIHQYWKKYPFFTETHQIARKKNISSKLKHAHAGDLEKETVTNLGIKMGPES